MSCAFTYALFLCFLLLFHIHTLEINIARIFFIFYSFHRSVQTTFFHIFQAILGAVLHLKLIFLRYGVCMFMEILYEEKKYLTFPCPDMFTQRHL